MKILLHLCCGPCTTYPLTVLREEGHEAFGFFYNPNIHPYREFKRRLTALESFSKFTNFSVEYDRNYGLKEFLRKIVFHEDSRCGLCYAMRLEPTVKKALEIGADAFSSTLLYSRYQNQKLIRSQAEKLAKQYGIPFYYKDFREGWQQGIDMSKEMDLYRQPYCGCIYSEQERYDKKFRKKAAVVSGQVS
jgi:predicted adenine nucleotide alpha hydrolase (AANH) superfamily ATPase